jgi:chaperonin GroES
MRGDNMKLQPINGRIVVRPFEAKEKTPGGIYLPDAAKEKLQEGKIIAIAEDATGQVVVGDRVIYKEFAGTEVKIEGEDYVLLTEDDLLAKYEAVDKIPE